jgi:hypothetical protein
MDSIVANILKHEAAFSRTESKPFSVVALFCGLGLIATLAMVSLGFDLGAGFL